MVTYIILDSTEHNYTLNVLFNGGQFTPIPMKSTRVAQYQHTNDYNSKAQLHKHKPFIKRKVLTTRTKRTHVRHRHSWILVEAHPI